MKKKLFKTSVLLSVLIPLIIICTSMFIESKNRVNELPIRNSIVQTTNRNFVIFDGMMYKKPDLRKYGVHNINVLYEDSLLDKGIINYRKLDKEIYKVRQNNAPICLDIESWDLRDDKYKENGRKYIEVLNYFKKRLPGRKIGYYGMFPYRDLYIYNQRSAENRNKKIDYLGQWERMNNNLTFITQGQDLAFPSLYTRSKDMELWASVTKQQIARVKAINPSIPIYGFVWPQYYGREFTSAANWAYQLETLYDICDGIVIWSPPFYSDNREPIQWDSQRDWWKETLKFIKRHNIS